MAGDNLELLVLCPEKFCNFRCAKHCTLFTDLFPFPWCLQEAFRSIEDIHGLMSMVKKSPKPQMMAIYYAKLTKIFWVSDSNLYHAYAWYKLYNLQKSYNKNLTQKDLQLMASSVLLATLSVTPYDRRHGAHHFELEMEKDRNVRMANLLGFTLDPKRDTREVVSCFCSGIAEMRFP